MCGSLAHPSTLTQGPLTTLSDHGAQLGSGTAFAQLHLSRKKHLPIYSATQPSLTFPMFVHLSQYVPVTDRKQAQVTSPEQEWAPGMDRGHPKVWGQGLVELLWQEMSPGHWPLWSSARTNSTSLSRGGSVKVNIWLD